MARRIALGCALALLLGWGGWVLARAPVPASSAPPGIGGDGEAVPHTHVGMPGMANMNGSVVPVGGLAASGGGYSLVATDTTFTPGVARPFTFQITGPDGRPVNRFAVVNDKTLHFIVVRTDLADFAHLHPTMAPDGTWSISLTLPEPGSYRGYADFTAIGTRGAQVAAVLAIDLRATGTGHPHPPAARTSTVDGFTVTYRGSPVVGTVEPILFRVTRAGQPVPLQHYLGTYGHLVVLRQRDLGYLHIHPEPALADGAIKFWLAAPSTGTYRVYLNFQVAGAVHTAEFTLPVNLN